MAILRLIRPERSETSLLDAGPAGLSASSALTGAKSLRGFGWSRRDWNDIIRSRILLEQTFGPLDLEHGMTDQEEPWAALIDADTSEVVAHIARNGGHIITDAEIFPTPLESRTVTEAVSRLLEGYGIEPQTQAQSGLVRRESARIIRLPGIQTNGLILGIAAMSAEMLSSWGRRLRFNEQNMLEGASSGGAGRGQTPSRLTEQIAALAQLTSALFVTEAFANEEWDGEPWAELTRSLNQNLDGGLLLDAAYALVALDGAGNTTDAAKAGGLSTQNGAFGLRGTTSTQTIQSRTEDDRDQPIPTVTLPSPETDDEDTFLFAPNSKEAAVDADRELDADALIDLLAAQHTGIHLERLTLKLESDAVDTGEDGNGEQSFGDNRAVSLTIVKDSEGTRIFLGRHNDAPEDTIALDDAEAVLSALELRAEFDPELLEALEALRAHLAQEPSEVVRHVAQITFILPPRKHRKDDDDRPFSLDSLLGDDDGEFSFSSHETAKNKKAAMLDPSLSGEDDGKGPGSTVIEPAPAFADPLASDLMGGCADGALLMPDDGFTF